MLNTSFAPWPSYTEEEQQAVAAVVASNRVNYWTGQEGRKFEEEFASWAGASKAVALANGTVALDLALKGLGVGPGDEVIVTPRTFIASISCVVNAGATPVFADVDPDSGNITPETSHQVLTASTKAIIPVHLAGWPCDMAGFQRLAKEAGLSIIEDCAQAHGAKIGDRMVGGFGDVGAWSFCQDKIITTGGEGGMVTTDKEDLWRRMWSYKDHGKSWAAVYERDHPPGFRWLHEDFGTNWRMLEVQAVLGRIQLRRMADWSVSRQRNAEAVAAALSQFPDAVRVPKPEPGFTHAYYRLYAYVRPEGLRAGWSRDRIIHEITARNVPIYHGSASEVYLEKAFDGGSLRPLKRLPVARDLGETSLMFLTHPTLRNGDISRMVEAVTDVLSEAAA